MRKDIRKRRENKEKEKDKERNEKNGTQDKRLTHEMEKVKGKMKGGIAASHAYNKTKEKMNKVMQLETYSMYK